MIKQLYDFICILMTDWFILLVISQNLKIKIKCKVNFHKFCGTAFSLQSFISFMKHASLFRQADCIQ